ncbi:MAG: RNA 2',3'-cyclic phosphodiesterase [Erysipelotrichaceae bacterium]|nr:RNA 2',3'-cyclic phosphodiesterase [Erysipelotrichaceae bacterium]
MRLFLALLPNEEMITALTDIQNDLKRSGVKGRYTDPFNLHMTLAYIGEYGDTERVIDVLEETDFGPFEITLKETGAFRDLIHCTCEENDDLNHYVKLLRHRLSENDIPFDSKPFIPHITLVRRADFTPDALHETAHVSMFANRVSLMHSAQGKNGMVYTELACVYASDEDKNEEIWE